MCSLRIILAKGRQAAVLNPQASDIILGPAHPIQEQEMKRLLLT